jgi:hypothetical protein
MKRIKFSPLHLISPRQENSNNAKMLFPGGYMGKLGSFAASISLGLSSCCGGIAPEDLLWRTRSEYQAVYPINVRNDSILIGYVGDRRFFLLDPATGVIADTLSSLENATTKISFIDRFGYDRSGDKNRHVIPVSQQFYLDSLVLSVESPKMRGQRYSRTLLMRRREDRQWATVPINSCEITTNDYVPYKDRYLLLQYATYHGHDEYSYEVGLLDLTQAVHWRK